MSTGKDQQKARGNKVAQGWEEAGSEFYQESFPTDLDGAVITRDPTVLATLLPSKQNRAGKYWKKKIKTKIISVISSRNNTLYYRFDRSLF